jgi:hypothetical protein
MSPSKLFMSRLLLIGILFALLPSTIQLATATPGDSGEKLVYFTQNKSMKASVPTTTEVYTFDPVKQTVRLIFSDEKTAIVLEGIMDIESQYFYRCSKDRIFAMAKNRHPYYGNHFIVEISTDGSNRFRRIYTPGPDSGPVPFIQLSYFIVNPAVTKLGCFIYQSSNNTHYLQIYDTASGNLLKSTNLKKMQQQCLDCQIMSVGWLSDNRILLIMDIGCDDGDPEASSPGAGIYSMNEDGSNLVLLRKYFDNPSEYKMFIGETMDKSLVYYSSMNKSSFIIFENPLTKATRRLPVKGRFFHVSLSGKYLAFAEVQETKDYRKSRVKLWYKNLETNRDSLIFDLGEINTFDAKGVNIIDWIQQ